MNILLLIAIGLVAGWLVNVMADLLPTRRPWSESWSRPIMSLLRPWQQPGPEQATALADAKATQRRYWLVYGAAVLLGLLAGFQETAPLRVGILAVQAWFFLTIAVIDLEHRLVLNRMLLFGVPLVLVGNVTMGTPSLTSSLLGGVAGFGFFLLLALLVPGAMGMGDVKLAGFIGLITGLSGVTMALFFGILAGGIAGAVVLIRNRFRRGSTIAYAPYLVLGVLFFLFDFIDTLHLYLERL